MNLLQLALAAEELTRQHPGLQVTPGRCVHSRNRNATCDTCVTGCPSGAITLVDHQPVVNMAQCIKCGVCLHTCPTGTFEGSDNTYHLLNCVSRLVDHEIVDVVCEHHPQPDRAARNTDALVQTTGCLAEIAPSAYVGLAAIGVRHIRARLDACGDCPVRILQPEIERTLESSATILAAFGQTDRIQAIRASSPRWRQRPRYQAKNPPLSRRGFFSVFTPDTTSPAAEIAPQIEPPPETAKYPPLERRRLLRALTRLAAEPASGQARLDVAGFASYTMAEGCTACEVCTRICPTAALTVQKTPPTFAVNFNPSLCTDCGLCVDLCEPGVLHRAQSPTAEAVRSGQPTALYHGTLRQCTHCKTWYSGNSAGSLCPVCDFRRQNPIGGKLPDTLLDTLPEATRARLRRLQQPRSDTDTPAL